MSNDAFFNQGFLAEVFQQNPTTPVKTRFPPEPNGFLHLGHVKAILIDFGFAEHHDGDCTLRFDDTNPVGEEAVYFEAIREIVEWLGFKPSRVTYSSDNFDRLYELAETLIQKDKAYVCHCSESDIKAQRGQYQDAQTGEIKFGGERFACPHRNRPVEESLHEFRAMKDGKYGYQGALLRMKQDLTSGNPQMWDLTAYRILKEDVPHIRTGNHWKMYPTYDFTHCLCDSIEGITHSLCTDEFELSRESYNWLCDELGVYRPMQREFGRFNLEGAVLSKRRLRDLVNNGAVDGWDDPRLYTLIALRRRGVPPGSILTAVREVGVSKSFSSMQVTRFEQTVRKYLETTVPRLFVVLDPVPVFIENLPEDYLEMVEIPYGKDLAFGVPFTRIVYIDRSDFREVDSKDYFRLAPGKAVGLMKVPYPIIATSFDKNPKTGEIKSIQAQYVQPDENGKFKKAKTYIHWVGLSTKDGSPRNAIVRHYHPLFTVKDPSRHPEGFLAAVNRESKEVFENAMVDIGIDDIQRRAPWPAEAGEAHIAEGSSRPEAVRFQGLRAAYYCVDSSSAPDQLVLNRIVSLKEDSGKSV